MGFGLKHLALATCLTLVFLCFLSGRVRADSGYQWVGNKVAVYLGYKIDSTNISMSKGETKTVSFYVVYLDPYVSRTLSLHTSTSSGVAASVYPTTIAFTQDTNIPYTSSPGTGYVYYAPSGIGPSQSGYYPAREITLTISVPNNYSSDSFSVDVYDTILNYSSLDYPAGGTTTISIGFDNPEKVLYLNGSVSGSVTPENNLRQTHIDIHRETTPTALASISAGESVALVAGLLADVPGSTVSAYEFVSNRTITWNVSAGSVFPSSSTTDPDLYVWGAPTTFTAPNYETTVTITASFAGDNTYAASIGYGTIGVVSTGQQGDNQPPTDNQSNTNPPAAGEFPWWIILLIILLLILAYIIYRYLKRKMKKKEERKPKETTPWVKRQFRKSLLYRYIKRKREKRKEARIIERKKKHLARYGENTF